jgi:hippurate hydrolase
VVSYTVKGAINMTPENLLTEAMAIEAELVENRRYLHANAEVGFDLSNTLAYVRDRLTEMGYKPQSCGKAGLVAVAGNPDSGKCFMLRADMDALPVCEQSGESFACDNGAMHACGHDMHTAMLLGAARLLKKHENELKGCVKLMFQSAEEIFEGSKDMISAGLLENPKVDAALMVHVMAGMPFEAGTVVVSSGGVSAPAADYFEIKVQGKGCHGSMPNTGVDPLTAAAHILIALQEINARELAMDDRAVLTIGTMHAGSAANAIPDTAVMGGSIRTFDEEIRSFVKKRLEEIAEGIAKSFRAEATVSFGSGCPTLMNDVNVSASAEKHTRELLGNTMVFTTEQLLALSTEKGSKSAGSEDFAYVSRLVPSVMLALAAGQAEKGYVYPQHHPKVRFDEKTLPYGSAVYAYNAIRWLEDE